MPKINKGLRENILKVLVESGKDGLYLKKLHDTINEMRLERVRKLPKSVRKEDEESKSQIGLSTLVDHLNVLIRENFVKKLVSSETHHVYYALSESYESLIITNLLRQIIETSRSVKMWSEIEHRRNEPFKAVFGSAFDEFDLAELSRAMSVCDLFKAVLRSYIKARF